MANTIINTEFKGLLGAVAIRLLVIAAVGAMVARGPAQDFRMVSGWLPDGFWIVKTDQPTSVP